MPPPENPKIYHIVHVDRLLSIVAEGGLLSDAEMANRPGGGTVIGMSDIKRRRLTELTLASHPGLYVGECVPFYFCPRSVMLTQLDRLATVSEFGNVSLGIIPPGIELPVAPMVGYLMAESVTGEEARRLIMAAADSLR